MAELIEVTDPGDERLVDYLRLTDAVLRTRVEPARGLFIAESEKVIRRAVAAGYPLRSLLTAPRWVEALTDLLAGLDVPVYVAGPDVLAAITGFQVHRGALAAVGRLPLPAPVQLAGPARLLVVLEDIVDHTNVGAVFRSAAGLGADAVLVSPRCADPFYRRSVRVSMGTVLQVPWTRMPTWPGGLAELRGLGFCVVGMALTPEAIDLQELVADTPERVALVLGTEGCGLAATTLACCDLVVRIQMSHLVDSLNVAAAAAVAVHAIRAGQRARVGD